MMVTPINTNEYILKNNELVISHMLDSRGKSASDRVAADKQHEKDLAVLDEGYKVWLLDTYFPGVPGSGGDAIHALAVSMHESMTEATGDSIGLEYFYQEIAAAFSVALTSLGVTGNVVNTVAPVLPPIVLPPLSSYAK